MNSKTRLICVTGIGCITLVGFFSMALMPSGGQVGGGDFGLANWLHAIMAVGGTVLLIGMLVSSELSRVRLSRFPGSTRPSCEPTSACLRAETQAGKANPAVTSSNDHPKDGIEPGPDEDKSLPNSIPNVDELPISWEGLFHDSPVAQAICSSSQCRFIEVNPSFLELLNLTREAVLGKTDLDLDLWPKSSARESWWQLVQEKRSVRDVECEIKNAAGEILNASISAQAVSFKAQEGVLLTFYDLTVRSHRELHVRQTQKLEAITQLAAGFAHDFNNILCIIQGHTSLLQMKPGLDVSDVDSLKQVSTAAERGANLTRQLLTFSRKQVLKAKTLDLNLVIHGMSNMLLRIMGKEIALRFDFSGDVPLVRADTGMLEQVIMNLAMNARDAMPKGGQITLHTAAFAVDDHYVRLKPEACPGQFACLTVSDTGCGLEPEAVSRIFEPFFTTKDVGKGSGLGLSTVYGIIKQHQGWIEVASSPGQGTVFKVFLPASAEEVVEPVSKQTPFTQLGGREKIFLVEDEPGLLTLAQNIFEHYGYEVITATNGVHALEVWESHGNQIELLVTDVVMPEGLTGCELAKRLRTKNPQLKVIYTSGYCADLVEAAGEELIEGVNFIQKPYRPQALAQTVRARLDQDKVSSSDKAA